MAKKGKRIIEVSKKVDNLKLYAPSEAIDLILETKSAKFDESLDIAFRLGVDPKHADQQIRGTVILPHGTGKDIKILVMTQGDNVEKALEAGATYAGSDEYIEQIKNGWFDFDIVIATPDMMPKIGRLGKILGTKGLMPNPKSGTVTTDIVTSVSEFKKGKIAYRIDKFGSIHMPIGRSSFTSQNLKANLKVILNQIVQAKPSASKGIYLKTVALSLTMGPGVKLDSSAIQTFVEEK